MLSEAERNHERRRGNYIVLFDHCHFDHPGYGSFDLSKFYSPWECFCKNPFPEERPVMVEGRSIVTASTSGNKGSPRLRMRFLKASGLRCVGLARHAHRSL